MPITLTLPVLALSVLTLLTLTPAALACAISSLAILHLHRVVFCRVVTHQGVVAEQVPTLHQPSNDHSRRYDNQTNFPTLVFDLISSGSTRNTLLKSVPSCFALGHNAMTSSSDTNDRRTLSLEEPLPHNRYATTFTFTLSVRRPRFASRASLPGSILSQNSVGDDCLGSSARLSLFLAGAHIEVGRSYW